jgi:large subunit ribosomal protein L17
MKHQVKTRKLSRTKPHREAMLANMAVSLFQHQRIKTTDARAKALRQYTDRLIAIAKSRNTVAGRRQVFSDLRDETVVKKLFDEIAPQLADRSSGFTRVVKIGPRKGDGAAMSLVQLLTPKVEEEEDKKGKKKGKKKKKSAKAEK